MENTQLHLDQLVSPAKYVEPRQHLFPSESSWSWFSRQHRQELVAAGAMLKVAGRWVIDAPKADAAVMAIGAKAAQAAR